VAPGLRDKLMIAACVAASVGAALAVQLKAAGELCYPIDDGWVYCVYARNLAEGHGYSFNEGDHFVCGTTSLLWPLLLTPCYWLFRDCMAPAEALGAIFLLFTCILVHKIARKILAHAQPRDFLTQHGRNQRPQHEGHEVGPSSSCPSPFFVSFASFVNFVSGRRAVRSHDHFGNDFTGKGLRSPHDPAAPAAGASALPLRPSAGDARWADRLSVLIPVFLAFSGFIAWSVLSGMETMLFTLLTVASVWYRLKHPDWRSKRYLIASAMAAVSGLARPEGFLLAGMFMADSVICRFVGAPSQDEGQLDRRVGRSLTCQLALLGLVLIPYVTVNYLSCSMPFPTSFMVEPPLTQSLFFTFQTGAWGTYVMHLARALPRWLADLARVFGAENVLLLLLLPVGAVATLRQARRTPHGSGSLILPLLVLAYPLVRAVFLNSHVLGQAARHVHNLMPLFYLLAGVALLGLTNGWRGAASGCALGAAGVCAVFGLARALDDFLRARLSLPSLGVQHMAPALWVSGLGPDRHLAGEATELGAATGRRAPPLACATPQRGRRPSVAARVEPLRRVGLRHADGDCRFRRPSFRGLPGRGPAWARAVLRLREEHGRDAHHAGALGGSTHAEGRRGRHV